MTGGAFPPNSAVLDLAQGATGRAFRVRVALPFGPPPDDGYPALYVLDGDAYFGVLTDLTRNLGGLGGEMAPVAVIAIGYPDDDPQAWQRHRTFDYSPGPPGVWAGQDETLRYGGLDLFLSFVEETLKPALTARWTLDPQRTAIFGHSLGGLAALAALFRDPAAFAAVISVSPALWWGRRAALRRADGFEAALPGQDRGRPRVFIAVGEHEEVAPPGVSEALAAHVRRARMVALSSALAGRLRGHPGMEVCFKIVPGETHVGAPYPVLAAAMRFAFPPASDRFAA